MDKKIALVTGANSGFGYLIALKFAREGWKVFASARDLQKEGVGEMNRVAKDENLDISWLVFDVTDGESIGKAAVEVESRVGKLDVLVNNAGFGVLGPIESYKIEDFQKQFDTNFFGVVRVTYAFLPLLKKSRDGRIINMSSLAGLTAAPIYGLYAPSKHALETYTEILRYELRDSGIKVSLIEPGGFDTDFSKNAKGLEIEEGDDSWYTRIKKLRQSAILSGKTGFIGWIRNPRWVADKIFSVANKRNPKLRNTVGFGTPTTALLRRILPDRVWEWAMMLVMRKA